MAVLNGLIWLIQIFNDVVHTIGRAVSIGLIGLMVLAILVQVFWRYVLSNPLPWPDEAARFCMLWLTGLMAPMAYRRGGFVAIDMITQFMATRVAAILAIFLLVVSGCVLAIAIPIGIGENTGFSANFKTASLYYPTLDGTWEKVPRIWMSYSLLVGVVLLMIVNVELILRAFVTLLGGGGDLRPIPGTGAEVGAE
ncbi:MAG: TRAP transporter small permease subunit [Pseudomonadota bacterium]